MDLSSCHLVETKLEAIGSFHANRQVRKDKEARLVATVLKVLEWVKGRDTGTRGGLCSAVLEQEGVADLPLPFFFPFLVNHVSIIGPILVLVLVLVLVFGVSDQIDLFPRVLLDERGMHKVVRVLQVGGVHAAWILAGRGWVAHNELHNRWRVNGSSIGFLANTAHARLLGLLAQDQFIFGMSSLFWPSSLDDGFELVCRRGPFLRRRHGGWVNCSSERLIEICDFCPGAVCG